MIIKQKVMKVNHFFIVLNVLKKIPKFIPIKLKSETNGKKNKL